MFYFEKVLPVTGLQYKSDPGLPITYVAFAIIMVGVLLAAIPHRHVWVAVEQDQSSSGSGQVLYIGGTSRKAKVGFERALDKLLGRLKETFALTETVSSANIVEKEAQLESKANV